jgi:hypothetical protein
MEPNGCGTSLTLYRLTEPNSTCRDLGSKFPPLKSRVPGCRHVDSDGVSRFDRAVFLGLGQFPHRRRAQPGSRLAASHRRRRRAASCVLGMPSVLGPDGVEARVKRKGGTARDRLKDAWGEPMI